MDFTFSWLMLKKNSNICPNLVVLHSTSNRLKGTTESKKRWRGLDALAGRKSTLRGENIPPHCRKYSLKIGGENLLAIYFALPVDSYKTILALEKIQLKWSWSTNKSILVSFSSYFFLGGRILERISLWLESLLIF